MNCSLCERYKTSKAHFHCPACARAVLYPVRVRHASVLIERESFSRQVEQLLAAAQPNTHHETKDPRIAEDAENISYQQTLQDIAESRRRVESISAQASLLRSKIETARREILERKETLSARRLKLNEARAGAKRNENNILADTKKTTRLKSALYDKLYNRIVLDRGILCGQVADLAGLRRKKYKSDDGRFKEVYSIGSVPIFALTTLHQASHIQITTSLTHIARLVVLVCGYLNLRLPAEITTPHADYPLATIFSPSSSYTSAKVPFPGSTPVHSTNTSPSASRSLDIRQLPRTRPLYLDNPLPTLARDDPTSFGLFVEGATYLAWDIAWLCAVAGIPAEDATAVGKNLWALLGTLAEGKKDGAPPRLGQLSHGTAYAFLGGSNTPADLRNWSSPTRLVDQVKATLLADISGLEWEMVDGGDTGPGQPKGMNGWTKLKSRSGMDM